MKPEQIIEIIRKYAINETNQAGDSGDVIWNTEFSDVAFEICRLNEEEVRQERNKIKKAIELVFDIV